MKEERGRKGGKEGEREREEDEGRRERDDEGKEDGLLITSSPSSSNQATCMCTYSELRVSHHAESLRVVDCFCLHQELHLKCLTIHLWGGGGATSCDHCEVITCWSHENHNTLGCKWPFDQALESHPMCKYHYNQCVCVCIYMYLGYMS